MPRRPAMVLLRIFRSRSAPWPSPMRCSLFMRGWSSDRMIFLPPPPTYPDGPEVLKIPTPGRSEAGGALPAVSVGAVHAGLFSRQRRGPGRRGAAFAGLRDRLGVSVLGWDYRGYGQSGGKPGEPATLRDAHTVRGLCDRHARRAAGADCSLWSVAGQRTRGGGGGEPAGWEG